MYTFKKTLMFSDKANAVVYLILTPVIDALYHDIDFGCERCS